MAVALVAFALPLSAPAQDWKLISLDKSQLTFVDGARVQRNEVAASIWVLESFPEVRYVHDDWYPHRSRSLRYVFNCSDQTYAIAEWVIHEGALGHGRVGWADRAAVPTFVHVGSSDPEAALLAAACDGAVLAASSGGQ